MIHPFRLYRTLAPLSRTQIADRLLRRLRAGKPARVTAPMRALLEPGAPFLPRPESLVADDRVRLLDIERGSDWASTDASRLWQYHLHYMEGVRAPDTPAGRKAGLIAQWIAQNPPLRGTGWEAYPISLRLCSWICWLQDSGMWTPEVVQSVGVQLRALELRIEWHLGGNHLLANAKALIFGGLIFAGAEAERWCDKGWRILEAELPRQMLGDGGHVERSPSYHALITEDLLDLINLGRRARFAGVEALVPYATRALAWLCVMTRPDGCWPLFNDAAQEVAPDTASLIDYAVALGLPAPEPTGEGLTSLIDSGYHRYGAPDWEAWIDAGPLGPDWNPGHGHADVFSFELFAHGAPLIVDTGVSTYDPGPVRAHQRGTAAHNTVELGREPQAELWGAFRVGRRPRVRDIIATPTRLAATHDGYRHRGALHRRTFDFAPDRLTIDDKIVRRRAAGDAIARLHFAPGTPVSLEGGLARAGAVTIRCVGARDMALEPCEIADGFNRRLPSVALAARFGDRLRTVISL